MKPKPNVDSVVQSSPIAGYLLNSSSLVSTSTPSSEPEQTMPKPPNAQQQQHDTPKSSQSNRNKQQLASSEHSSEQEPSGSVNTSPVHQETRQMKASNQAFIKIIRTEESSSSLTSLTNPRYR